MSAVLVRNNKRGIVTFADPPNNVEYEWQPGDIQAIPEDIVSENPNFVKALRGGTLSIVDPSEETQARLAEQDALMARKAELQKESVLSTIDREAERTVASVQIEEEGRHVGRVSPTVIVDTGEFDEDGKPITKEQSVVIDPRV